MKDTIPNILNDVRISVKSLQGKFQKKEKEDADIDTQNKSNKTEKTAVNIKETQEAEKTKIKDKSKATPFQTNKIGLCIAEFVGTALLLFLGCMGCITEYEGMPIPHYMPALSFGLTVMLIIQIFGHISGAHLNPAVTIVTVMFGYLDKVTAAVYLVGQFAGAIFGLGALKLLVPEEYAASEVYNAELNITVPRLGLCTTLPNEKLSVTQAVVIEAVITAVLILVCCSIWDRRNAQKQDSVPLRFGLIIAAIAIAAGPLSGASMNTARSFAPAILNGDWKHQWIYWVGPNAGAVIAGLFYKSLYSIPDEIVNDDDILDEVPLKNIITEEKV